MPVRLLRLLHGRDPGNVSSGLGGGDLNGDGLGGIFIADVPVQSDAGGVVVFGWDDSGTTIAFAALDGSDGFRAIPPAGESLNVAGFNNVAAAGAFKDDGIDHFVIGARALSINTISGQVFVIFVQTSGFGADLDVEDLDID